MNFFKMWVMPFARFAVYFPLLLILKTVSILLSPFLSAWSVIANIDVLPYPFNLFHTHDDTLDGGQHQLGWPKDVSKFKLWLQRMKWIFRNPAYGFSAYWLGFSTVGHQIVYEKTSNPLGGIPTDWRTAGNYHFAIFKEATGKYYFGYRRIWKDKDGKNTATWIGWNYIPYDDVNHHMKINFIKFSDRNK